MEKRLLHSPTGNGFYVGVTPVKSHLMYFDVMLQNRAIAFQSLIQFSPSSLMKCTRSIVWFANPPVAHAWNTHKQAEHRMWKWSKIGLTISQDKSTTLPWNIVQKTIRFIFTKTRTLNKIQVHLRNRVTQYVHIHFNMEKNPDFLNFSHYSWLVTPPTQLMDHDHLHNWRAVLRYICMYPQYIPIIPNVQVSTYIYIHI